MTSQADRPLRLLTGPAGSGRTQRALQWIRDAATREGDRGRGATGGPSLLVLPTYAQVEHTKRMALARWGTRGLLDRPFTTFTGAGERFLATFAVRALPSADERDRLMEAALEAGTSTVFDRVRDRAGFRARCLALVKELKQSGLPPEQLARRLEARCQSLHPVASERLEAFIEAFGIYTRLLQDADMEDHEDTLRRLWHALEASDTAPLPDWLVFDGFDDLTPVEEAILLTLARRTAAAGGHVVVTLPDDPARPGLFPATGSLIARLTAAGFEREHLPTWQRSEEAALGAIATRLFQADAPPAVPGGSAVFQLVARDRADEADRVARYLRRLVLEPEASDRDLVRGWRDIVIAARRVEDVEPWLAAACRRHGVPLRGLGTGRPLASVPLVRALRGLLPTLAATEAGKPAFDPHGLTRWLRFVAHATDDEALLGDIDALEIRHRHELLPRNHADYARGVPPTVGSWLARVEQARVRLAGCEEARPYRLLGELLPGLVPCPTASGLDERGVPRDRERDRRVAEARSALGRLQQMLAAFDRAVERTGRGAPADTAEAVLQWDEAIRKATFQLPDRRLDAVSLLDAETARSWEAPVVVVMALEAGRFPRRPREDVILRDADRDRLREGEEGLTLPKAREREQREARLFYGVVTRARRRLVLSTTALDEAGRPRSASRFLRALEHVVTPTPLQPDAADRRFAPAPSHAVGERDLLRWAGAIRHDPKSAPDQIALANEIVQGAAEARARAARRVRAQADPLAEPTAWQPRFDKAVAKVSPSKLRDLLLCPYRFFLARVVGVPEDEVPFSGPRADARREGGWMHRALESALREPGDQAEAIAARTIDEPGLLDPPTRMLIEQELTRVITLLRARESRLATGFAPDPTHLEWPLGDKAGVPLQAEAASYTLHGRVDRLDRRGSKWIVTDYKRSPNSARRGPLDTKAQEDLQLPLYAAALEQLTNGRVVGLEWIAIQEPVRHGLYDEAHRLEIGDRSESGVARWESSEAFRRLIDAHRERAGVLVEAVRAAQHDKRPADARTCAACAYLAVCRPAAAQDTSEEEEA